MEILTILLLVGGFLTMLVGGELLVRHAARFAALVGMSPLVIGLTIVAFGTSAPELAVSVIAGYEGKGDVAVGNVVGSNTFNILFILGACAAVSPLFFGRTLAWIDVPIMIGSALLLPVLARDGHVQWVEGALLIAALAAYTLFVVRREGKRMLEDGGAIERPQGRKDVALVWIVGALAVLVIGSRWFVDGAVRMAQAFGVSELVIGLTIVAAGTSLPEVITSILATIRGQREIAAGNVVGSNIFNVLGVLGTSAIAGGSVKVSEQVIALDGPIMVAVSLVLFASVARGLKIGRIHGLLFLAGYAAYTAWLILHAGRSTALPQFERALIWYCLPIATLLFLGMIARKPAPIAQATQP